jgi:SsrA-binding protein
MGEGREREVIVCVNRKARHDYLIEETYEAGLVLTGSEVKSLRAGRANLKDSHARITAGGEAVLVGTHISPYGPAVHTGHEPTRPRKLLMHRRELARLIGKVKERGFTLVPLRLYFKGPYAKIELALARGKRQYDKRVALREKDVKREMARALSAQRRHPRSRD